MTVHNNRKPTSRILPDFSGRVSSFVLQHYLKMPLQRTPLRSIDVNSNSRGPNLTPY
jgi:hypothetical protein